MHHFTAFVAVPISHEDMFLGALNLGSRGLNYNSRPSDYAYAMGCVGSSIISEPTSRDFPDARRNGTSSRPAKGCPRSVVVRLVPNAIIDGSDSVDLESMENLMDPSKSWNANAQRAPTNGLRIPMPPNRRMHERHVAKMDHFLQQMCPGSLTLAVDLKRDRLALRALPK